MLMSISTSKVFPISSLPLEIMSSNQSQSLLNSCLVSSLIFLSLRSTFLWASTSTGDLMKLLADVRMLCKSVSVSTLVISATGHCDRAGIQFLGVMSICSILKTSPSVSSFSTNATTWFSGNSKYWSLLRFTITNGVTESLVFSERSANKLYMYILGFEVMRYSSGTSWTLSVLVVLMSTSTTAQLLVEFCSLLQ